MPTEAKYEKIKPQKMGETIALSRKSRTLSMVASTPGIRHGTGQWKALMKSFHESHKETCKATPKDIPMVTRSLKQFPTGSTYEGTWNLFGMNGRGTFVFPQKGDKDDEGVKYVGDFKDGLFHGHGELQYDCGATIKGKWNKGVIGDKTLVFADGLEYNEKNWKYCRFPDRRYTVEYDKGMEPAGRSYITAEQPPLEIPPGLYDCGDGFYDPITKTVYKYYDLTAIIRSPYDREQKWIVENCRYNPDYPIGPCHFLYETWREPTITAEEPPPPAARTKTYEEELLLQEREIVPGQRYPLSHIPIEYCNTHLHSLPLNLNLNAGKRRQSRRSVSRLRAQSLFPQLDFRKGTDAYTDREFYRPSFLDYPSDQKSLTDRKISIRSSSVYDNARATSNISTATFGSIYYEGESTAIADSSIGLMEKPKPIVNW